MAERGDTPGEERRDLSESEREEEEARREEGEHAFEPELEWRETHPGARAGDRFVRIKRPAAETFERVEPGTVRAKRAATAPKTPLGRFFAASKTILIGPPLPSEFLIHERLTKLKGLAVLSSDALSSVAYATEEILLILILAGTAALTWALPLSLPIAALIFIVSFSYRQTIRSYPRGGGSYIVTKDNLGTWPALVAAGALLFDYILTVAVSIAAGVAAITSAFPGLYPERVPIALGFIALMTIGNLRGVRESGNIFSAPTYLFLGTFLLLIGTGLVRAITGTLPEQPVAEQAAGAAQSLTLFLLLRAFAGGCTALTGIEAIADGVPAFKPPESKNAATTLSWLAALLITLFLGIGFLATRVHIVPLEEETVVSQLARVIFGSGSGLYYLVQVTTTAILVLAANTSFSDFPRLAYFLARDRFLPRHFMFRGDRLALSTGITLLAFAAGILIVVFQGDTHSLIPLYVLGVFTAFTLSQASMVRRWWVRREPGWHRGLVISAVGAATTGVVAVILGATKFSQGAWITVLLVVLIVAILKVIERHYHSADRQLQLELAALKLPERREPIVLVPVPQLNRAVMKALGYAMSISKNVVGVHVTDDLEEARELRQRWQERVREVRLVVLESPYRLLAPAFRAYIDALDKANPGQEVTVVVAEVVPRQWWQRLLHRRTARRIEEALRYKPHVVVVHIPYHLAE